MKRLANKVTPSASLLSLLPVPHFFCRPMPHKKMLPKEEYRIIEERFFLTCPPWLF
jgi:hypothetical protein